ncbi:hypothetical protein L208DRAFT_1496558, partial [Tricholoma matsutake]
PLLGAPPIPVLCSIILTSDFPLLEAQVALIGTREQGMPSPPLPSYADRMAFFSFRKTSLAQAQEDAAAEAAGTPPKLPR